jgi:hypothetical protein
VTVKNARRHFVIAAASLLTALAGAAIAMLLVGDGSRSEFFGWFGMLVTITYPSFLVAMGSEARDRCSAWLRRMALGRGRSGEDV